MYTVYTDRRQLAIRLFGAGRAGGGGAAAAALTYTSAERVCESRPFSLSGGAGAAAGPSRSPRLLYHEPIQAH